jgi:uncharacterized membrane protein
VREALNLRWQGVTSLKEVCECESLEVDISALHDRLRSFFLFGTFLANSGRCVGAIEVILVREVINLRWQGTSSLEEVCECESLELDISALYDRLRSFFLFGTFLANSGRCVGNVLRFSVLDSSEVKC